MKYRFRKWVIFMLFIIALGSAATVFLMNKSQTKKTPPTTTPTATQETNTNKQTQAEIENNELLTLVNYQHKIPAHWQVDLVQLKNGQSIDKRAYDDLQKMMDDARSAGLSPMICSSYRTNDKQKRLFQNEIQTYLQQGYSQTEADKKAAFWVARPGTSEHQMGLALDIVATANQHLDESQEKTPEQQWLIKNCARYGFILRYPNEKSNITQVGYEPWHYRYVGKEHAQKIMDLNLCLEEYLDQELK